MFKIRLNYKRLSIWILLILQIVLITSYFYLKIDNITVEYNNEKISFIHNDNDDGNTVKLRTYHTISDRIYLKSLSSRDSFIDFNSSLCYTNGTDLILMKRTKDYNWECNCLPGWHGKDCGQPEVIWRAFLTYRRPIKITGPRIFQRRIIYIFELNKFSETITEIRLNELWQIVDLFILYENQTDDFIQHKLNNNFLKEFHNKIIYLKVKIIDQLWESLVRIVRNLRDDDIILTSNLNEIPNKYALNFLKFYDGWPELLRFRLRWSVFGYFWLHPSQTIITGGACSINYFKTIFNKKLLSLTDNKTLSSPVYKGIILGDLNHYGGWYCELCYDSQQIVEFLTNHHHQYADLIKLGKQKIDQSYIEDIIENGLYIDGRIELKRTHRYHDNYFAPYHVIDNNWKYDFLLTNFYSKIDYYEG